MLVYKRSVGIGNMYFFVVFVWMCSCALWVWIGLPHVKVRRELAGVGSLLLCEFTGFEFRSSYFSASVFTHWPWDMKLSLSCSRSPLSPSFSLPPSLPLPLLSVCLSLGLFFFFFSFLLDRVSHSFGGNVLNEFLAFVVLMLHLGGQPRVQGHF